MKVLCVFARIIGRTSSTPLANSETPAENSTEVKGRRRKHRIIGRTSSMAPANPKLKMKNEENIHRNESLETQTPYYRQTTIDGSTDYRKKRPRQ